MATKKKASNARKTSVTPTMIYSYSCMGPLVNADKVHEQLLLGSRYYNELVRIENDRRESFAALRVRHSPGLADAEKAVKEAEDRCVELREQIKATRKQYNASAKAADKLKGAGTRTQSKQANAELKEAQLAAKAAREIRRVEREKFNTPLSEAQAEAKARAAEKCEAIGSSAPRIKERVNAEVFEEMMGERKWSPAVKEAMRLERDANAAWKAARKESACYTATRGLIDAAITAAKKDAMAELFPKRFDGTGRIGVQLKAEGDKKGATIAEILGGKNTFLRMRELKQLTRGRQGALVDIRIGSDGAAPVWATFSVYLHRPIPEDAIIKWAWVKVSRVGARMRYDLQITLETNAATNMLRGKGTCALHLAWRQDEGEMLRVGYVAGSDGKSFPVYLPSREETIDGEQVTITPREMFEFSEHLRGLSDKLFDAARERTKEALASISGWPAWVAQETSTIHAWHGHKKLARVALRLLYGHRGADFTRKDGERVVIEPCDGLTTEDRVKSLWDMWRDERKAAELDLYDADPLRMAKWFNKHGVRGEVLQFAMWLEWWRRKDAHLYDYETSVRRKAENWRNDFYRCVAKDLRRRYERVLICDTNLAELARLPKPEEDAGLHARARAQRKIAATSTLRGFVAERFDKAHTDKVKTAGTASVCCECGGVYSADASQVMGRCENGHVIDRDENAARNMLRDGPGGAQNHAPARVGKKGKKSVAPEVGDAAE